MKKLLWVGLLGLCFSAGTAEAYIPPIAWLAKKMTSERPASAKLVVSMTVLKPAIQKQTPEEPVAQLKFSYTPLNADWPLLTTLIESNVGTLQQAWKNFGIAVPSEQELLAFTPQQIKAAAQMPRPFYKINPDQQLMRFPGGIAYVTKNPQSGRAVWIAKDSNLPVRLAGLCPESISKLSWIKGSETNCRVDFDHFFYKSNQSRPFRFVLRGERQDILVLRIDSIQPGAKEVADSIPSDLQPVLQTLLGI